MKQFFLKYFKEIMLVILTITTIFLLIKIFTPAPDKSDLLKYKLDQLDLKITDLKKKQKDLDDSIAVSKKDIQRIDENIENIKSQKNNS